MSAQFLPAFDYMIRNEDFELSGEVTSEPNGGRARFGINSLFHQEAVEDGYYSMTKDSAFQYCLRIFQNSYWAGREFDQIEEQRIATKLFDMAVNMGNRGEILVLQDALEVPTTGIFDGITKEELGKSGSEFIYKLVTHLKAHYSAIYERDQKKYRYAISGWLSRAAKVPN